MPRQHEAQLCLGAAMQERGADEALLSQRVLGCHVAQALDHPIHPLRPLPPPPMQLPMHSDNTVRFTTYTGAAIAHTLRDFQRLHVTVFYDWPYLYDGDPAALPYIAPYTEKPRAAFFLGRAAGRPIGLATCLPLEDESASVQAPFRARGWDVRRFF